MKLQKKFALGIVTLSLFGSSTVAAATITTGTVHVPGWGGHGVTSESNTKVTNSKNASFRGVAQPNSFGYKVCLADSNKSDRSSHTGLYLTKVSHAANNSLSINHYGYGKVFSQAYEPNGSYVKLKFSSDNVNI